MAPQPTSLPSFLSQTQSSSPTTQPHTLQKRDINTTLPYIIFPIALVLFLLALSLGIYRWVRIRRRCRELGLDPWTDVGVFYYRPYGGRRGRGRGAYWYGRGPVEGCDCEGGEGVGRQENNHGIGDGKMASQGQSQYYPQHTQPSSGPQINISPPVKEQTPTYQKVNSPEEETKSHLHHPRLYNPQINTQNTPKNREALYIQTNTGITEDEETSRRPPEIKAPPKSWARFGREGV